MYIKCIEIRDHATCIPAIAIKMEYSDLIEHKFLWRCGYPQDGNGVVLMKLDDQKATSDPYEWGGRTMPAAHLYILENWDNIKSGDVVDSRVYLKETDQPAEAEIHV